MVTPEDYVKYYYFIPPTLPGNYTVNITVTPRTAGFYPSIYALRNDIINSNFNYKSLNYPNIIKKTYM